MDRQIFIFTGPTLSPEEALPQLSACYLPPVQLGDIYRLCELFEPRIIGIIDGYFNQAPAVWHKEILYALSRGIAVYGAASMGALRAAELDPFGMIGCGKIYQAYRIGVLPPWLDESFENDDEVAVIHAPAELGYKALSEALINMRISLAKAMKAGIISSKTAHQLVGIAGQHFYADRSYATLLEAAREQSLPARELDTLETWLTDHAVDQKRLDAIELLQIIKRDRKQPPLQPVQPPPFQHTSQWQSVVDEIALSHRLDTPLLDELRLQGDAWFESVEAALGAGASHALEAAPEETDLGRYHRAPEKLAQLYQQGWLEKQRKSEMEITSPAGHNPLLLSYLQNSGQIDALATRAEDKQKRLARLAPLPDSDSLGDVDRLQLADWYFSHRLGVEMPARLENYVERLGLTDLDQFYDMILAEYLYLDSLEEPN